MSAYMEMARPAPLAPASPPVVHGFDAAGNGVCLSPTLVHNGYHAQATEDGAYDSDVHPDAPYHVLLMDGSDDEAHDDADEFGRPRVAHAPGVGGHYWSPGQTTAGAGAAAAAAAASSEAVGRQIATMLESLAGLDSGIASAAAAMFVPTVILDEDERARTAADAAASRVSHMRMAGTSYTPDPMVTRGRMPAHRATAAKATAPAETESGGETYVVERTTNLVYYDDDDDDGDGDDNNDRDEERRHARRRVVHGDAYAYPAAVRRHRDREGRAPASSSQAPTASSSSSCPSSSSSSSSSFGSSSSSSFFSGTTFGSSTQPTTRASSSVDSSSSSSSDTSDSSRPRRRRRRSPCSPSSGDTVSISSISAPWASAFSTVSSAASTTSRLSSTDSTSSDSALTIPKRRNGRRGHAQKRAHDSTASEGDSTATDVEEIGRRARRLVQLARIAQGTDGDTDDADTVDPHAVASRARHNRRR
ncbi:hypothetical protein [Pandoravirus japonicus]|uniref:Uncharacterized protein n=1 Tax=Pandoravirus japonicus TaxID=2823154 RepID=A0A811BRR0_9VIRU|nr:hypothetical protein [Pandoravirus japonicus]